MQIEILRFLVQAKSYLRDDSDHSPSQPDGDCDDLQAVERSLPDCDWFEREEMRERGGEARLVWDSAVSLFERETVLR